MDTGVYLILSIVYLILFILGIRFTKHYNWFRIENVLLLVILALFYDNGILALGKYIGEGILLKDLNEVRFWLHALFTPLLVLFSWKTIVNTNIQWANKSTVKWLIVVFTLGLIVVELATVVSNLSLESSKKFGVLSYTNTVAADSPPFMIIGVSVMLIIASIIVWRKQQWPWFFAGIVSMGIIPILSLFLKSNSIHNISELLLMIALVATMAFQDKKDAVLGQTF